MPTKYWSAWSNSSRAILRSTASMAEEPSESSLEASSTHIDPNFHVATATGSTLDTATGAGLDMANTLATVTVNTSTPANQHRCIKLQDNKDLIFGNGSIEGDDECQKKIQTIDFVDNQGLCEHQVRLVSNVRCCELSTKWDSRINFGFRGYFGVKQSPRNTFLGPPSRSDVPLWSETKRIAKSSCVSR